MRIEADTVDEYIAHAPAHRRQALRMVRDRIMETTPVVEETLDHGMPFFTVQGRSYIAVASQKHHVSLYVALLDASIAEDAELAAAVDGIDRGKNCLRFRDSRLDRLDVDLLDRLIAVTYAKRAPGPA